MSLDKIRRSGTLSVALALVPAALKPAEGAPRRISVVYTVAPRDAVIEGINGRSVFGLTDSRPISARPARHPIGVDPLLGFFCENARRTWQKIVSFWLICILFRSVFRF